MTRTWFGDGWFLSCHVEHALVAVQIVAICVWHVHVYRGHKCISWFIKAMCGSRRGGGGGPDPHLQNNKNIWFPSNTGPDTLKKSQSYQASIQCWAIIGPPAKRHSNGVSLAGQWWPTFRGIWIVPPLINLKKNVAKVGPPLTKLYGSAHVYWWCRCK